MVLYLGRGLYLPKNVEWYSLHNQTAADQPGGLGAEGRGGQNEEASADKQQKDVEDGELQNESLKKKQELSSIFDD